MGKPRLGALKGKLLQAEIHGKEPIPIAGPTGMLFLCASADAIGKTVFPHPTMSEAIMEAAQKLCGYVIYI